MMPWLQVARLFQCSWCTVAASVAYVVAFGLAGGLSGSTNQKMIAAYESGDPTVCGAMRTVKRVAQDKDYMVDLLGQQLARDHSQRVARLAPGCLLFVQLGT